MIYFTCTILLKIIILVYRTYILLSFFTDDPCSWFTNAMEEVERLDGDNKYSCERCDHLVEAERSVHYQGLPSILTLHLKRFAALDG